MIILLTIINVINVKTVFSFKIINALEFPLISLFKAVLSIIKTLLYVNNVSKNFIMIMDDVYKETRWIRTVSNILIMKRNVRTAKQVIISIIINAY